MLSNCSPLSLITSTSHVVPFSETIRAFWVVALLLCVSEEPAPAEPSGADSDERCFPFPDFFWGFLRLASWEPTEGEAERAPSVSLDASGSSRPARVEPLSLWVSEFARAR
jgi:hypothetical protein